MAPKKTSSSFFSSSSPFVSSSVDMMKTISRQIEDPKTLDFFPPSPLPSSSFSRLFKSLFSRDYFLVEGGKWRWVGLQEQKLL